MHLIQPSVLRLTILACTSVAGLAVNSVASAQCVGVRNTCFGENALISNTTGRNNSAFGTAALRRNTTGSDNTAVGEAALVNNTTGYSNTASGTLALAVNTTGAQNTAHGYQALLHNTGSNNTATGGQALQENVTGDRNTAGGFAALFGNYSGSDNTATGDEALANNATGDFNTASGAGSLRNNTTGVRNVALGYRAGSSITTGSDNIIIGAKVSGVAAQNGAIRIGTRARQKKTFIAGIRGVKTGLAAATAVFIDANGQLGTIKSSRQFKEDIQPMASVSERLFALRPVTFRYKESDEDGSKPVQYGLIAEEVAEAFPELVINGQDGKPETVSYHLLATLLLNEFQKERQVTHQQAAELERQSAELAHLKHNVARMADVVARLDHAQTLAAPQ